MATILITGADSQSADFFVTLVEAQGHYALHAVTTENVIEDMTLNEVDLVIAAENTEPYTGLEVSSMISMDPGIPGGLPVLLVADRDHDPRELERHSVAGVLDTTEATDLIAERLLGYLGDRAYGVTLDATTEGR